MNQHDYELYVKMALFSALLSILMKIGLKSLQLPKTVNCKMGELLVTANHYFGGETVAKILIAKNDYFRES